MGKMAECMEFQDYLQAGVHDSVREGTPAASWAKVKMRLTKSLRHLADSRSQWLQTFASASGFGGTEEALIENLIGYTLTQQVQINMTTGAFEKIRVQSEGGNKASDPALMSLLEGQAALIKSLTEKVNSLSEAPTQSEKSVPPFCLKELHDLALVWNHPQWVTRVLYCLRCAILKEALPLDSTRMTPKWDDEAQKPLLFSLSDDQKKDTTLWTEVVGTGGSAGDAPMDGSSDTPPPPVLSLNSSAHLMVESLWLLVWSSVHCYKERYESDPTSSKQASADPDFTSSLSTAGARLKKVMRRRFKMVDGLVYFEVHKGEWVRSDSAPAGPCKTCKGHGSIERHWVWNCPRLE